MNRTVERTIEILDIISQRASGISLAELVEITGYPKTSIYDILRTLEDKNVIYRREHPTNSFSIGFRAFAIGNTYCSNSHLLGNAQSEIELLGNKLNKPVLVGKPYRKSCLYVAKYQPKDSLLRLPKVWEKEDQTTNAMGLLFQMLDGKKGRQDIEYRKNFPAGYVLNGTEENSLVYSIAAPIFNFERFLSGAIMVVDLNQRRTSVEEEASAVVECAAVISKNMGYRLIV